MVLSVHAACRLRHAQAASSCGQANSSGSHASEVFMSQIKHFPPPPGIKAPPLSFATRVGDLLFISGIPGFDEHGALPETFEAQFANVVKNLRRVLNEAGADIHDLVKVNVLLTRAS